MTKTLPRPAKTHQTKLILLTVTNPKHKLLWLYRKANFHFQHREPILILTPSEKVSDYIDQMLWSFQPNQFLPHEILSPPHASTELIQITHSTTTLAEHTTVFNLTPHPLSPTSLSQKHLHRIIYHLDDQTTSQGRLHSQSLYRIYKNHSCSILTQ